MAAAEPAEVCAGLECGMAWDSKREVLSFCKLLEAPGFCQLLGLSSEEFLCSRAIRAASSLWSSQADWRPWVLGFA